MTDGDGAAGRRTDMKRLTKRLPNGVIHVDFAKQKESVMGRLAAIEDILGDEYDLERLKFIMDAERHGELVVGYPRDDPGPKGALVFALVAGDTRGYPRMQKQTYLFVLCAAGPIQRPHGGSRMDNYVESADTMRKIAWCCGETSMNKRSAGYTSVRTALAWTKKMKREY